MVIREPQDGNGKGKVQAREQRSPGPIVRVIRGVGFGVLALVLIPIAGIIGFFVFAVPSPEEPDPACFARPVLDVRVGEKLFAIPRVYDPGLSGDHIPMAGARICQRFGDPPIAANEFWIDSSWWPRTRPELDPGFRAQISVYKSSAPLGDSSEGYSQAKRRLDEKGIAIDGAEERNGFLTPEPVDKGLQFYIAAPGTFETPRGYPLTLWCNPTPEWSFGQPNRTYLGHGCRTHYIWSENVGVSYRFGDAWHPIERWGELDASIQAFLRSLEKEEPATD